MSTSERPKVRSCGIFIWRQKKKHREFLLMEHPKRWDLPKGHVDPGETDLQCALRETVEETAITADDIRLDENFLFVHEYEVSLKRFNGEPADKTLVIYLAELIHKVKIQLTEHDSYKWVKWDPPHKIQKKTIDPLLAQIAEYWANPNSQTQSAAAASFDVETRSTSE